MSTIAYRPERSVSNPPRDVSMHAALCGSAVRLEAPEELGGPEWDGPVYAILEGEPKNLQPTDTSPFVLDEGERVPAWRCKLVVARRGSDVARLPPALRTFTDEPVWIPYWRLTQPQRNLSRELHERPLLTVFRFARLARFFLASPDDDTKLVLRTPGVLLCCQVLAYRATSGIDLVDDIGIIIEPGSSFLCIIALRRHAVDDPVIAAVPLTDLDDRMITTAEYLVGYGHGLASTTNLVPFSTGWASFLAAAPSDPNSARAQLFTSFLAADPTTSATIDTGTAAVPYVTPQGVMTLAVPADFALQAVRPSGDVVDGTTDEPSNAPLRGGPLLRRDDVALTPVDAPCVERVVPPLALPPPPSSGSEPLVSAPGGPASPATVPPQPSMTATERLLMEMLKEQKEENRRRQETTDRHFSALADQMNQFAATMARMQQQSSAMPPALQGQTLPQLPAPAPAPPSPAPTPDAPPGGVSVPTQPTVGAARDRDRSRSRRFRTYDADHDDIERNQSSRNRPFSIDRDHRFPHDRTRRPDDARGRREDTTRDRRDVDDRDHHGDATARDRRDVVDRDYRGTDRDARERSDRSPSRERSPRGRRPSGADFFRPSDQDLNVHWNARVHLRTGTDSQINLYHIASTQDRVRSMYRLELYRGGYKVTKTTTKMLFCVDFSTRGIDHFVPNDARLRQAEQRIVVHDPSQWGGSEPAPVVTITRPEQLHAALRTITDAASTWYPDALVRVFRSVHSHAATAVPHDAPTRLVNAIINLYGVVFMAVYDSLSISSDLYDLEGMTLRILDRNSADYQRHVGYVIQDALMDSIFRNPVAAVRSQPHGRATAHTRVSARAAAPPTNRRNAQQPVLPAEFRGSVPKHSGKEVCLRFQTMKDCDFPACKREHALVSLDKDLVDWLELKHGSLKSDHPSA